MRTCALTLAAFVVMIAPLRAQSIKTLDLRAKPSRTLNLHAQRARKSFYVILAARGGSATGHAFVLWGIEDGVRRRTTIQAFGLYPDSSRGNCSTLVRTVPGGIVDEMQNHSFQAITEELILRVDEEDFNRSWKVARQWDCRHEYSMLNRDCVEFVRAVGDSLHLDMPRRAITRWTPQAYVRALLGNVPAPTPLLRCSASPTGADF
jgi:hypothetical protein